MQFRAVVCCALCVHAGAVSAQSEERARAWLSGHPEKNSDDLLELKDENPDAYALVKALLTKRTLGLLDPRHPTASFAAPPPRDNSEHVTGAAVYAKFATTQKEQDALQGVAQSAPYPEASTQDVPYPQEVGATHDWMNWKPHDGASDDEAMVKNVLGAVAGLTNGKSLRGPINTDDASPLATETASIQAETVSDVVLVSTTANQPAVVPAPEQNSYLVDSGLSATVASQQPVLVKTNSVSEKSSLDSFTWGDSQPTATTTAALQATRGANPLASWLGFAKPHVQAVPAVAVAVKPTNPYMMDLQ